MTFYTCRLCCLLFPPVYSVAAVFKLNRNWFIHYINNNFSLNSNVYAWKPILMYSNLYFQTLHTSYTSVHVPFDPLGGVRWPIDWLVNLRISGDRMSLTTWVFVLVFTSSELSSTSYLCRSFHLMQFQKAGVTVECSLHPVCRIWAKGHVRMAENINIKLTFNAIKLVNDYDE